MGLNKIKVNNTTTVNTGVVYDISKATSQSYDTLSEALGTNGNNVPSEVREGGMSIRFISNSDNKYMQYRLMSDTFNTTPSNWQSIESAINITNGYFVCNTVAENSNKSVTIPGYKLQTGGSIKIR